METDALGGKPLVLTLVQMLRLAEGKLRDFQRQKQAGQEYTLPSLGDDGSEQAPQSLDELIASWEKEKSYLEIVIAWAEAKKPGSSRQGDGELLLQEYENLSQEI